MTDRDSGRELAQSVKDLISKYRNAYHPDPDASNKSFNKELEGLLREAMEEVDKKAAIRIAQSCTAHSEGFKEGLTRAAEVASGWCGGVSIVGQEIAAAIERLKEETND